MAAKTSSSDVLLGETSSTPMRAATSFATSFSALPEASSTVTRVRSSSRFSSTMEHPSTVSNASRQAAASPRSTTTNRPPARAGESSPGFPSATSFPRSITSTRPQLASTSERMWVESSTVCSPPRLLMSERTSRIWFGSMPAVGSSRISSRGFATSASASPVR